jgi:hypothetical protein
MKARSIIRKQPSTTNTRLDIIGRRRSTMKLVPTKRQAITLIWRKDIIYSPLSMLKRRQSIKLKNTTFTEYIDALEPNLVQGWTARSVTVE